MNLLNNQFLLYQINNGYQYTSQKDYWEELPRIISMLAPMMDSGQAKEVLDSFFGALGVLFVPLALSFGYPALLLVLASDKQTRVIDLLRVNGLRYISYWASYFLVYLSLLTVSSMAFLVAMISWAEFKPFVDTSFTLLAGYLLVWNISQLSFALASAKIVSSVSTAGFIGYIVGTFFVLVCSGVSLGVLPGYTCMPWLALLVPQSNLVRFMYATFYQCVDKGCPQSLDELNIEAYRCLKYQLFSACLSMGLALAYDNHLHFAEKVFKGAVRLVHKMLSRPVNQTADRSTGSTQQLDFMQDDTARVFEETALIRGIGLHNDTSGWISTSPNETLSFSQEKSNSIPDTDTQFSRHNRADALVVQAVSHTYDSNDLSLADCVGFCFCICRTKKRIQYQSKPVRAVRNVSLFVEQGQTLGILGPNGSGKTTLLQLLTSNKQVQVGRVWTDGSIGYCPQFDLLFDDLTVQQHLVFFSLFKGASVTRIGAALQGVDLTSQKCKTPAQLSGGMRRRTSLAISLLGDCPLVVLDEPSTGLDPTQRRLFWRTLKQCTANRAVLLTTHLMDEAEFLCDRITVMVEGKIRTVGKTGELRQKYCPGTRIEIFFLHDTFDDHAEDRQQILDSIVGVMEVEQSGRKWRLVVDEVYIARAIKRLEELREAEIISEWSMSRHTLEEVFLKVVSHFRQNKITILPPIAVNVNSDIRAELEMATIGLD